MEQKLRELQHQLYLEALSLRERVIEYYRSVGDPDPYSGLPVLLQHIADKLNQDPADISWLEKNLWGIYRVVSDSYYMERTTLGNDLYKFKNKVREFMRMIKENS